MDALDSDYIRFEQAINAANKEYKTTVAKAKERKDRSIHDVVVAHLYPWWSRPKAEFQALTGSSFMRWCTDKGMTVSQYGKVLKNCKQHAVILELARHSKPDGWPDKLPQAVTDVRLPACPPARLPACPPARLPACPPARLPHLTFAPPFL